MACEPFAELGEYLTAGEARDSHRYWKPASTLSMLCRVSVPLAVNMPRNS